MQIKKSELRKVVKEHMQMFFSDSKPFATVGRAPTFEAGIEDPNSEEIKVDQDALDDAIAETIKGLEKGASMRMRAEARGVSNVGDETIKKVIRKIINEISGVDSLKPNDPHTPEDEAEKDAADDVMEADPKAKKGGRPRGGPHIENVRFWDLPESSLRYIIKDASDAVGRLPFAKKAGKWADEVNDAVTVLHWRKKKGITVDEGKDKKKKDKIRKRPWVSGLDPAGGIGEAKEMKVKDKKGFIVDGVGSLASTPKSKALVKKMYDMVSKKLKLKSIEDVQPIKDGIGFIFGDPNDAKKMAAHLNKAGVLGKVMKLAAGGGKRTLVSLKT
jgi:hypothetical protein